MNLLHSEVEKMLQCDRKSTCFIKVREPLIPQRGINYSSGFHSLHGNPHAPLHWQLGHSKRANVKSIVAFAFENNTTIVCPVAHRDHNKCGLPAGSVIKKPYKNLIWVTFIVIQPPSRTPTPTFTLKAIFTPFPSLSLSRLPARGNKYRNSVWPI